jgi:hypothetical protein
MKENDRKENRRKNFDTTHKYKNEISEEQRFLNKAKKQLKKKKEDVRADEAWNEWEDFNK